MAGAFVGHTTALTASGGASGRQLSVELPEGWKSRQQTEFPPFHRRLSCVAGPADAAAAAGLPDNDSERRHPSWRRHRTPRRSSAAATLAAAATPATPAP